jgi:hypothetical protein
VGGILPGFANRVGCPARWREKITWRPSFSWFFAHHVAARQTSPDIFAAARQAKPVFPGDKVFI